ncbi:hypothetical protein [uncultured Methanobrevibacter sp.]|uniref:hypothetical protein n=1 Tax=uncultured Methanobrevibacter sp. TaxID=253161 RepID=UPI0025E3B368|nr:hypothetical protein [uncultured Methanobrevibacter sp.]
MAGIFSVIDSNYNVRFYNINFINGKADFGGAIFGGGSAYNCTFTGNKVDYIGGAMYYGNAYNCTFTGNQAINYGGAMAYGSAYNCTFTGNKAGKDGGAMYERTASLCRFNTNSDTTDGTEIIPAIINVINYTSPYQSGERLKFNLTVNGTLYDRFNTTIKIYKDGSLVKTVYALSGEGWIVDLEPGTYTAVLSLTDYPKENSTNASIIVSKNKVVSKIIANPVTTTYNIDKYLVITLKDEKNNPITREVLTVKILGSTKNYRTDSNGQVKIKVPTSSPKTYTARIKYAGSDKYKASSALGKITVKKATPKITAKPASYKLKVKTKKIHCKLNEPKQNSKKQKSNNKNQR